MTNRQNTNIWLTGQHLERITGSKLPSNGDILRRLLFLIRNEKKTVRESSSVIIQELLYFWKCARIPTMID